MSENTLFITENPCNRSAGRPVIGLDDLILTQDAATSAGSKMLAGFKSLFEARVVERLHEAGYDIAGKVNIGEFGFDFLGESSYFGPVVDADGHLVTATAKLLMDSSVDAVVGLDVNGAQARAATERWWYPAHRDNRHVYPVLRAGHDLPLHGRRLDLGQLRP